MRLWRAIIAGVIALGIVAVAGELLVRSVPSLLPPERQIRYQAVLSKDDVAADPEIGFVRAPGRRELIQTLDYTYLRQTDAHGFPNVGEWPSATEMVILGDSLVMGEGVGIENGFVNQFAREASVAVVNLGVAGAGPDRQRAIYEKYGAGLRPGLVLSFIYLAADITNDEHFRAWKKDAPLADYNKFRLGYANRKDFRSRFHPARLMARSRLLAAISHLFQPDPREIMRAEDGTEVYLDREAMEFLGEDVPGKDSRVEQVVRSVARIKDVVERGNARFLVVLIPSKEEVLGKAVALQDKVKTGLKAASIPFLDLQQPLEQAARTGSPYYKRDIHLNQLGNSIVTKVLVDWYRADSDRAVSVAEHAGGRWNR